MRISDWSSDVCSSDLEAQAVVNANEQLARRFAAHFPFSPFSIQDADDFREFRSVLKVLQTQIPLPFKTPLYEANMARRCQIASHGLLDYTRKVLEGAVSVASRSEEHTSELQSLMRISYAVFCLKK